MSFFLILVLSLVSQFFLPWWIVAVISFLICFWRSKHPRDAFVAAFGAVTLLWVSIALVQSIPNDNILAERVAAMFGFPHWSIIALVTGVLGGLVAGIAGLAGYYTRKAFRK